MTQAFAANLFAFSSPDPETRRRVSERVRGHPAFSWVGEPGPGWVAGLAPLPPRPPIPVAHGLVVAQDTRGVFDQRRRESLLQLIDVHPEDLHRLPGDFSFLRCRTDGSATVARAVGGSQPLFLWRSGDSAAVSTCLSYLLRFVDASFEPDLLVLASHASGCSVFPNRRTAIEGVSILARGHYATIGRDTNVGRYWSPPETEARWTRATFAEHAREFRSQLLRSLRDAVASEGNLLSFSGGVDSSAIASLLMGRLEAPLSTVTFLPDGLKSLEHEGGFVDRILRQYPHRLQHSWKFRLSPGDRLRYLERAPLVPCVVTHPVLHVLPDLMRDQEIRVLFGGEFADELFGSIHTFADWAHNTTILDLILHPLRIPSSPKQVRRWARHHLLWLRGRPSLIAGSELPPLFADELREEYRDWYAGEQARLAADARARAFLAYAFEESVDVATAMNWEVASSLGVARSYPLLDRSLLELVFRCPPREAQRRMSKRLLRHALKDDVVRDNLFRRDKGLAEPRAPSWVPWSTPIPDALRPAIRPVAREVEACLPTSDALRLRLLLNMLNALRTSSTLGAR